MTGKAPKRPKDVNQLAKSIVDLAIAGNETADQEKQKAHRANDGPNVERKNSKSIPSSKAVSKT